MQQTKRSSGNMISDRERNDHTIVMVHLQLRGFFIYAAKNYLHLLNAMCMFRNIKTSLLISYLFTFGASFGQNNLLLQTSEVHNLMIQYDADKGSLTRFYFIQNSPERRERLQAFN